MEYRTYQTIPPPIAFSHIGTVSALFLAKSFQPADLFGSVFYTAFENINDR
ncbi:hypothetical protein ACXYMO_07315 [Arenibacterium sp. CAU 1754]